MVINPNKVAIEEDTDDDEDDEDAYFIDDDDEEPFDDEDDEEDEEMDGGMPRPKKGFSSKPEKHEKPSTFFLNRLKERDGELFLVKDDKPYRAFSRVCPANVNRQPIILTPSEKENIDKHYKEEVEKNKGSGKLLKPPYKYALRYGSKRRNNTGLFVLDIGTLNKIS